MLKKGNVRWGLLLVLIFAILPTLSLAEDTDGVFIAKEVVENSSADQGSIENSADVASESEQASATPVQEIPKTPEESGSVIVQPDQINQDETIEWEDSPIESPPVQEAVPAVKSDEQDLNGDGEINILDLLMAAHQDKDQEVIEEIAEEIVE